MKGVITILIQVLFFFILFQKGAYAQENIKFIQCEQSACSVQNPFTGYQKVTAKLKGKCTNGFVSGNYMVSYFSDDLLICQYEGDISDGKLSGNGKMTYSSKDWPAVSWKSKTYEGGWENGKYQGEGTFTIIYKDKTKNILTGNWQRGNLEGNGKEVMPNGDVYSGNFKLGKMNGKGKYNFSNGNWYEGEFSDGLIIGYGQYQTSEGLQTGYFANGKYIGKARPDYITTNISSKTVNSSPVLISKIKLLSSGADVAFINDHTVSFKVYRYNSQAKNFRKEMGTKIINLSTFSVYDTIPAKKEFTVPNRETEIKKSKDGKYLVTVFNRGDFEIYNQDNGESCARIKTCYGVNNRYSDRVAVFNSLEKMVGFSEFPCNNDIFARYTENVYYLRLHYFSETAPILAEKAVSHKYRSLYISGNDDFLFAVRNKSIDVYDANTLDFKTSIDIPTNDAEFSAQEGNYFIFKCNYDKYFSLQYYEYQDGRFKFVKNFPEQDLAIFKKDKTSYFAQDYVDFENCIAIRYNSINGFYLMNIIDKKTLQILFSRFVHDFIPNDDCSAFIVSVQTNINTNDIENYEPGRKHMIYNLKDTASLLITDVDLDREYTEQSRNFYRNLAKEREKRKQLLNKAPVSGTPVQAQTNSTKQKNKNEKIASIEEYRKLGQNVKEGNLNEIRNFVDKGYSFQPPSDFGFSVLTYAVNYLPFRPEIFRFLVDNGADVNYVNENTTTALSAAINKNNTEAVKMLLESGANPNFREDWTKLNISQGLALLEKAIVSDIDKKPIIKLLIAAGANVNNSTTDNSFGIFTTLGFAIGKALDRSAPDYELIKLLIDAGADVNGKVTLTGGGSSSSGTILEYVETKNPNSPIAAMLKNAGAKTSQSSSASKKYLTLGDISNVFSNNSSSSKNYSEIEDGNNKKPSGNNREVKENTGPSRQELKDGKVAVPNFTRNDFKAGGNLSLGDFDYSYYEFADGTSGTLYRGKKTNKYFISFDGINPVYYKLHDDAVKALYIYKKFNEITDAGKE